MNVKVNESRSLSLILILIFFLMLSCGAAWGEKTEVETLTVKTCVKTAVANHPDLKAYKGNIRIADKKMRQAESPFYPQITGYGEYDRYTYQTAALFSGSGTGTLQKDQTQRITTPTTPTTNKLKSSYSYDYYTGNVALSQRLYDFGKTNYDVRASRENLTSAQYDLLTKQLDIELSAKQAFFEAIANKKIVELKEEAVKQQTEHLDQAKAFYKQGVKAKIEVTKAEVDLSKAQIDLIKARNTYKTSVAQLSNAMGFRKFNSYDLKDDLIVSDKIVEISRAYQAAENNRPEIKKFGSDMSSYRMQKLKAQVENLPEFTAVFSYNWEGYSLPAPHYWYYGLEINFTLFDGFLAKNQAEEARENIEVLKSQKESKINDIYLEVEQSYLDLKAAIDQIDASLVSLKNARENFQLARGRYRVGLSTGIEFFDARVSLTESQSDYITSLKDYKVAEAKLQKAMGFLSTDE